MRLVISHTHVHTFMHLWRVLWNTKFPCYIFEQKKKDFFFFFPYSRFWTMTLYGFGSLGCKSWAHWTGSGRSPSWRCPPPGNDEFLGKDQNHWLPTRDQSALLQRSYSILAGTYNTNYLRNSKANSSCFKREMYVDFKPVKCNVLLPTPKGMNPSFWSKNFPSLSKKCSGQNSRGFAQ